MSFISLYIVFSFLVNGFYRHSVIVVNKGKERDTHTYRYMWNEIFYFNLKMRL